MPNLAIWQGQGKAGGQGYKGTRGSEKSVGAGFAVNSSAVNTDLYAKRLPT